LSRTLTLKPELGSLSLPKPRDRDQYILSHSRYLEPADLIEVFVTMPGGLATLFPAEPHSALLRSAVITRVLTLPMWPQLHSK
jgi:hypothetical protein